MSFNLHSIVRNAISGINAEERIYLIQSLGQENIKGRLIAKYAAPIPLLSQMQSFSSDELQAIDSTLRTAHMRKFYLFSETYNGHKPQGQYRITSNPEDFIYKFADKTFWKIFSVQEDFSSAGWVCVGAALQIEVPDAVREVIPSLL